MTDETEALGYAFERAVGLTISGANSTVGRPAYTCRIYVTAFRASVGL